MTTLKSNTLLQGGRYKIVRLLNQGGFGITYLAVYGSRRTKVAIKEFFMKSANQREADGVSVSVDYSKENAQNFTSSLEKFKKEAERLKQINSAYVVKVHDLFEENGTAYYVMDFVEGEDMESRLQQRGKPYTEKSVLTFLNRILEALAAIHSQGLLHLDLKPSNIMVTPRGYIKLIDLGASKEYISGMGATVFTGISMTRTYAAPEQLAGAYDKMGPWTDFYALGATIYKMLTNQAPPSVTDLDDDKSADKHFALPMPNVSAKTRQLVIWMLRRDRTERPQNVSDIKAYLCGKSAKESLDDTISLENSSEDYDTAMSYYNHGQYEQAFPILERLANKGEPNAMFRLGVCYYWDEGVKRSKPKSINFSKCFEWMTKAANAGNTDAMLWLGSYCYSNGEGIKKDESKVIEYTFKAAYSNNNSAKITLGLYYLQGSGMDEEKGSQLVHDGFSGLCLNASFLSREEMHIFAMCYQYGFGVEKDIQRAIYWYTKSADLGDPEAQNSLGEIYLYGSDGVSEDDGVAVTLFKFAASKHLNGALINLGDCYYYGWGVAQNFTEALAWYRKAAEEGDDGAMVLVGLCYKNGEGTSKNYGLAVEWFTKAKNKTNNAEAINYLGLIYEEGGDWIKQDKPKAVGYYKEAALSGLAAAQYNYGMSLICGEGVAKQLEKGLEWVHKAAEQDFQLAVDFLNGLETDEGNPPKQDEQGTPSTKNDDEEFSLVGCIYMIVIAVITALIVKFIFLK